jgi:2-phosphoglycerate kinase
MRHLYLIGGAAGAGKTTVARALSRHLDADWVQVDSIWIAIREALSPDDARRGPLEIDRAVRKMTHSARELTSMHIEGSEIICAALKTVLDFHIRESRMVVADGAWLLPDFMANLQLPDAVIRSVVVHEPGAAEVRQAMDSRRPAPSTMPWQELSAEVSWRYGNWLQEESDRVGIPVVAARPRGGLIARVGIALGA